MAALIAGSRLVTLTGPGGMGKTTLARLALASADDAERWFVDLWPIEREADVPRAIAAALVVVTAAEDAEAAILAYLRTRTALVVLDNVEHLPDLGRRVGRWLDEFGDLRILATSRMPLGVPGEQEVPVLGLALPGGDTPADIEASPAGRLFLDTARRLGALEVVDAQGGARPSPSCSGGWTACHLRSRQPRSRAEPRPDAIGTASPARRPLRGRDERDPRRGRTPGVSRSVSR